MAAIDRAYYKRIISSRASNLALNRCPKGSLAGRQSCRWTSCTPPVACNPDSFTKLSPVWFGSSAPPIVAVEVALEELVALESSCGLFRCLLAKGCFSWEVTSFSWCRRRFDGLRGVVSVVDELSPSPRSHCDISTTSIASNWLWARYIRDPKPKTQNNNTSSSRHCNQQQKIVPASMIRVERSMRKALNRAATMSLPVSRRARRALPLCNPSWGESRRYLLSQAVTRRLDKMVARHKDLLQQMEENPEESYSYGKELASLAQAVSLHERKEAIIAEEQSIEELLEECGDDEDMKKECLETLEQCKEDMEVVSRKIKMAVLPRDEDDTRSNAIVEIRAGTGGDEAGLFASELRDTYEKTAKSMNFSCETLSESRTDIGGIKETVISVSARGFGGGSFDEDADEDDFQSSVGPYGFLRYESGVHRVQRVPVNDTRIHTSACSVAVLPLLEESGNSEELLPMSELKIETMRSSGAGGQHVNTTDSAVRITHIPTGITASIQDARSQHKNKDKALKLIAARVRDREREEEERTRGATRSNLMGGGDRSERIRTYNYPQDRITDHRCKHSTHGISKLLEGGANDGLVSIFFPLLRDMVREEKMNELEQEELRTSD